MAILVTGGAGYIGSVTVDHLLAMGENVVVLDDLSMGHRNAIDASVRFYQGDVGDAALLARITNEHRIDACLHFAAFAFVADSVKDPKAYFENNVQKGIVLVGALLAANVGLLVFSSSCAIYGEQEKMPMTEDVRLWPKNPYGWTKLIFERLLDSYDTAYGLKFVALRYFNAAGASEKRGEHHEPETHLVANVLQAAAGKRNEVRVFGDRYPTKDGTALRDYVHVTDLAEGHVKALQYLRGGGESQFLNLGTGQGQSVLQVIEKARQVTGRELRIRIEQPRPGDPAVLIADAGKAKAILGWEPANSDLQRILKSAWDWNLQHPHGYAAS